MCCGHMLMLFAYIGRFFSNACICQLGNYQAKSKLKMCRQFLTLFNLLISIFTLLRGDALTFYFDPKQT